MTRSRTVLGFLVLAAVIGTPSLGAAEGQDPSPPMAALADFFRWQESIPVPLRDALRAYEQGHFFAALGSLDGIIAAREPVYALDDARYLRALSLVGLGWDELAVPSLLSVLEAEPLGPYYVPALLELIEIHDRAGRWGAIADAWGRYVDRPLRSTDPRSERIGDLLFEFGTLRPPLAGSTRREKKWLSQPEALAVVLEKRRERASDRLLYRSGLALFRLGRHQESLRSLLMIGIESPYYPYARYSIAQNFFALGQAHDATRTLVRLQRHPKITQEDRGLGSRAQLLHAAIRFATGEVETGIGIARSIADDDPEAPGARLLVTTALLDAGQPALALAYDASPSSAVVEAEASRALTVGAAYASLGDTESAARLLRGASVRVRKTRAAGRAREEALDRLRGFARGMVQERRQREQALRKQVSGGIRDLLVYDGPWSLSTLLRRVRAAIGAGPYHHLARGAKPQNAKIVSGTGPWHAYLASPRRPRIELALDRLAELESVSRRSDAAGSLRILNAYLLWFEQAPVDEEVRKKVARNVATFLADLRSRSQREIPALRFDLDAGLDSEVAALRRRLSEAVDALGESEPDGGAVRKARDEVGSLLGEWIDRELRELLEERDIELRDLELDLDVALAGTLARRSTPSSAQSPP